VCCYNKTGVLNLLYRDIVSPISGVIVSGGGVLSFYFAIFALFCLFILITPQRYLLSGSLGLLLGLEDLDNDLLLLDQEGADDAGTDGAG